jgi:hypothetical protein
MWYPSESGPIPQPFISYAPLVKPDIDRHGVTGWDGAARSRRPHQDPKTDNQIAIRAVFAFCSYYWHRSPNPRSEFHYSTFFHRNVSRWILLHAPAKDDPGSTDPSAIELTTATAAASAAAIALSFTPSGATDLWGIVILRSENEIITPDPLMAILFYPTETTEPISYLDSPLKPGTYHYRAAAFEINGALGAFSSDVFATVP